MDGRMAFRIVAVVALVALLGVAGVSVYNAGVTEGLAQSGQLASPGAGAVAAYPYYGPYIGHGPGFGFGIFGFLFTLLFLFLIFGLVRAAFGRGREWGPRGGPRDWTGGPPMFEEWHRRAHDERADSASSQSGTAGRP